MSSQSYMKTGLTLDNCTNTNNIQNSFLNEVMIENDDVSLVYLFGTHSSAREVQIRCIPFLHG